MWSKACLVASLVALAQVLRTSATSEFIEIEPGTAPGNSAAFREGADPSGRGFLDVNVYIARSKHDAGEVSEILEPMKVNDLIKVAVFDSEDDFVKTYGDVVGPVFVQRGVEFPYVNVTMEVRTEPKVLMRTWVEQRLRTQVGWVNYLDVPLELFWQPPNADPVVMGTLNIGERNTVWRDTYVGHVFVLRHPNGTMFYYRISTEEFHRLGNFPSAVGYREDPPRELLEMLDRDETERLSKVKVNFTSEGYKRIATPPQLFGDIRRFYNINRQRAYVEDMEGSIHINTWVVDSELVPPSFATKDKWHRWFQPVLEEWCQFQLEATDLYGIRTYHRDAVLLNHIDRHSTHAVSAIINIEQGGIDQDWPLEIRNVRGEVVHSDLQPGEAMLYESAKCMHGRPTPLEGDYYTNVFFHYRPVNDPTWFKRVVPGSEGLYQGPPEIEIDESDAYDDDYSEIEDDNEDDEDVYNEDKEDEDEDKDDGHREL
mmetsp:Transcript_12554/g.24327  ORF Transcript_12554/g.24327 Transcript_12554/m.24327 type:complete len:484 (+) Transcript_12554:91-1542(+)